MTLPCHGSNTGSTPVRIVALWAHVHLVIVIMNAIQTIKATYDYDQCKEIVDHGCQSGVCSEHIYYGDTVKFFEQHAEEITRELVDNFGTDFLKETFNSNDANLTCYMNDLTWAFIELSAMRIVDEIENTTQEEESDSSYNPPRSMTEARYAFA